MILADRAAGHLARWADPERAAEALLPGLGAGTAERLLRSPRTGERAARLLLSGCTVEGVVDRADQALLVAAPAGRDAASAMAGAVWHAPRVRALVGARDVAAFVERHGAAAREAAILHQALAPRPDPADAKVPLDELVARDGAKCLAAWAAALPGWAASWLRLAGGPAAHALAAAAQARAVAVVRAVAPA